ncbi:Tetratricopeptide repeat-containing protein [Rickettsiales endosymbiont of Paramecium tredecaurelia]|uniref:tetratricopeptide repeat protein n=1 Tax=Candidatus Sarmatiella mevalonica TaxID=2770581 RepID=UPI001924B25F|nr:hypothetical protein [Candidatus Sarmatiella mevalonica]MBL3285186.1 Tetratricopeptide repeat-containing protein [Candidatus Sarmatiella mevalonica]
MQNITNNQTPSRIKNNMSALKRARCTVAIQKLEGVLQRYKYANKVTPDTSHARAKLEQRQEAHHSSDAEHMQDYYSQHNVEEASQRLDEPEETLKYLSDSLKQQLNDSEELEMRAIKEAVFLILKRNMNTPFNFEQPVKSPPDVNIEQPVKSPPNVNTRIAIGNALLKLGEKHGAFAYFDLALETEPRNVAANVAIGNVFLQLGYAEEALKCLENVVVHLSPIDFRAHIGMGDALLQLGKNERALRHFNSAIELEYYMAMEYGNMSTGRIKGTPDIHMYIGKCNALLKLERAQEAREVLEQIKSFKHKPSPEVLSDIESKVQKLEELQSTSEGVSSQKILGSAIHFMQKQTEVARPAPDKE